MHLTVWFAARRQADGRQASGGSQDRVSKRWLYAV